MMRIKAFFRRLARIVCVLAAAAAVLAATGCGTEISGRTSDMNTGMGQGKLRVVATLFPYYDFVRQVAGDDVELMMVVPAGMDSHSFEPTPVDMRRMQKADLMIRNGGALETWVEGVLDAIDTSDLKVVTMMDYVDTYEEEIVEGMEQEEHGHDHDGHEMEIEYDEHIWTSPVNAMTCVQVIRDTLCEADPDHAPAYRERAAAYLAELQEIDAAFRKVSADRVRNMIVVGDKFPFRYLAEEYDLDYRAAFSGCSSDTEPSAKTIAYLIDKIRKEQIPAVYYLELSSHRVSEIISEETGAQPLLMHSCHNVARAEFDRGITYAQLMRGNIENLRRGICE